METHAPYAQWEEAAASGVGGEAASVTISPGSLGLSVGGGGQLTATALGADGLPLATTFTWTSTLPTVATVSPSGFVSATDAGLTIVRATAPGGAYDEIEVEAGTELYLISSGGLFALDDAGPATHALVYAEGTGLLQVDDNPAASDAVQVFAAPSGAITLISD